MPSTLPGPLDVRFDTHHSHVIALVDLDLIQRHIPQELLPALISIGEDRRVRLPGWVVHAFAAWLAQVLKVAERDPTILVAESTVRIIEQELFALLLLIAEAMTPNVPMPPASAPWRGLKAALEYLHHAEVANVTVPELCRAAEVSERTLQYAFRDVFGLTPLGFLRSHRLHAARRHLLISSSDETTVSQIAMAQGCYEPGRFASEYRNIFGELPSETLRRPAFEPDTNLLMV